MLRVEKIEVTPFAQNCRVIFSDGSREAVVVDPGGDVDRILGFLAERNLELKEVWLTHSHLDHCGGVKELLSKVKARLFGHKLEREMRGTVSQIALMYGLPSGEMQNCPEPDSYLEHGSKLHAGGVEFEVRFTPGHSPGHVVMYNREHQILIAGDTLFAGSIGRTDLPGGDHDTLIKSIRTQILSLPDSTRVLSGHGPDTSVGVERDNNPFL